MFNTTYFIKSLEPFLILLLYSYVGIELSKFYSLKNKSKKNSKKKK